MGKYQPFNDLPAGQYELLKRDIEMRGVDAGDVRQALSDAANHRIPTDRGASVHELHPFENVEGEPVVIFSPTGTVMVTRGEHTQRFRTRAAFDLDRESVDHQCTPGRTDGLLTFEQLQVLSQIKHAGEWHWVDSINRHDRTLLLREADRPGAKAWWTDSLAEGDLFTVAEPF